MAFPDGVQTVTINPPANGYRTPDGDYQQGTITLTPSVREVVSAEHGIIATGTINLTIGASGSFTPRAVLPCDAEGFTPTGWTYRLDQQLTGQTPRSYNVLIPTSAGSIDLSTLVDVEASDGEIVYAPTAPTGPAGGDLAGTYPNPTVARLNGVTVSGTPVAGQVPTATSPTAASWQTPTGGGSGGGTPADTVTAETGYGQTPAAGAGSTYSRGDHTHGSPSLSSAAATVSAVGATAAGGTASAPARGDHVHGREGFGAVTAQTAFGAAAAGGVASTVARSDHAHGTPSLPSASTSVAGVVQLDGTAADIQALGALAAGAVGKAADAGHVHPTTGLVLGTDPRLTDSRAPSGAASGDLSGVFPGPTVARVNGVTVSGVAASGKVLTASSPSAASWQTPSGGGGGATVVGRDGRIDAQIIVLQPVAGWAIVATSGGVEIGTSVPAAVGDQIWYSPSFLRTYGVFLDMGIRAAAGGVSRYTSSGTATPEPDGYAPLYPEAAFAGVVGMRQFVVQAGEVDGSGNATIVLAYRGNSVDGSSQKVYFGGGPGYSGAIFVANMGQ